MNPLPPELEPFAQFLDGLPDLDQDVFLYRLGMMLRQAGQVMVADVVEQEQGTLVSFETPSGGKLLVLYPDLDRLTRLEILRRIKPLLEEAEQIIGEP